MGLLPATLDDNHAQPKVAGPLKNDAVRRSLQ